MDKNQKRRQQEDTALNRGLLWVVGAIGLEFLLMLVNKYYINYRTTLESVAIAETFRNVLTALQWLALAGVIVCLVWLVLRGSKGGRTGLPLVLLVTCTVLLICAHVSITFHGPGVRMLFLLVPACAGLALVYYLYQREFFLAAVASALATLGLWLVRQSAGRLLYAGLVILGIVLVALAAYLLKKNGGCIQKGGREYRLLPKDAGYSLIFLTCGVGLVAMVVALAAGTTVAYYLVYAMVAWLFALLVYYTVKMM